MRTQSLWATHFKFLNDTGEVDIIRGALARHLKSRLGAADKEEIDNFVDKIHSMTFHSASSSGIPFADPFITSFCIHPEDDSYTCKNGLLSMWRAYGREGCFAVVFDKDELIKLIEIEKAIYEYTFGGLRPVIYEGEQQIFLKEFKSLLDLLKLLFGDPRHPRASELYEKYVESATRYKHRAFREEHEARIIMSPLSNEKLSDLKGDFVDLIQTRALKDVKLRTSGIDYIELFKDEHSKLPIKTIIVGPQHDQGNMVRWVEGLVNGTGIEVWRSETPFRDRSAVSYDTAS